MKKLYAKDFIGSKVYFTEADKSAQIFYRINYDEFDIKIKLWLLLANHIILSTGHMLESSITYNWLMHDKENIIKLIEEETILPSLREDRNGFIEYAEKNPKIINKIQVNKKYEKVVLQKAEMLNELFNTAITWSPIGESNWFRNAFLNDLIEGDSPLRKRMIGISKENIGKLANDIMINEFFDRRTLMHLVRKHCPERERLLLRYGDIFYYLSGALFKDALPVFNQEAVPLCKDKVEHAVNLYSHTAYQKGEIWRDIMDTWGITCSVLQKLQISEIIKIRHDIIGKKIRKTWKTLTEQASKKRIKKEDIIAFQKSKEELMELFEKEINRQEKNYDMIQKIKGKLEFGAWVTGVISTLIATSDTFLSIIAGIIGFVTGKQTFRLIEKYITKGELVIMATKLKKRL